MAPASDKQGPRRTDPAQTPGPASPHDCQDEASDPQAAFIEGLLARGEAARAVDGELPPGATHEIVEDEEGNTTVRRRRFSAS